MFPMSKGRAAVACDPSCGEAAAVLRLIPLLLAGLLAAADSWSGLIEISESLGGHRPAASEQGELDVLARETETRLREQRAEVRTLPPAIARTLRGDLGFYQTELERTVLARGGQPFPLGRTTYRLSQGRILALFDRGRLLIDRNRGTGLLLLDGETREIALAPLPAALGGDLGPGPEMLGRATRRFAVSLAGKSHECLVDPGLPNVYALAAVSDEGPDDRHADLAAELARLPGLPMAVTFDQGRILVRLTVTRLEPGPLPDEVFAPWR